jgi:hypothetical protein
VEREGYGGLRYCGEGWKGRSRGGGINTEGVFELKCATRANLKGLLAREAKLGMWTRDVGWACGMWSMDMDVGRRKGT